MNNDSAWGLYHAAVEMLQFGHHAGECTKNDKGQCADHMAKTEERRLELQDAVSKFEAANPPVEMVGTMDIPGRPGDFLTIEQIHDPALDPAGELVEEKHKLLGEAMVAVQALHAKTSQETLDALEALLVCSHRMAALDRAIREALKGSTL